MDWIVAVSPSESPGGALAPETEAATHAAFREHGVVLLRGMFPPAVIEAMHQEYLARYGSLDMTAMGHEADRPAPNRFLAVGGARCDITLRMTGAFGRPDVFANPGLLKILAPVLGEDFQLSNFTTVVSHPGAPIQHIHRDMGHLFPGYSLGAELPVYAVNVALPLIDVDLRTGPTGVWLGSHRWPGADADIKNMTVVPLQRGDCMMLDYRTLHTGLPNAGRQARPIVYMVYARPWFFDYVNHVSRVPLDMPLEDYNKLPPALRPLMTRAYSYAVRARWTELDGRNSVASPPVEARNAAAGRPVNVALRGGKVGRNDPCPCGSGKKFKQCHGQLV